MSKLLTFLSEHVAPQSPIPCDFKPGDVVTVINGFGLEIKGQRVLGFMKQIDPEWRPAAVVYLDWDCFWFPVELERLTLET